MSKRERRHFSSQEKAGILKEHLFENKPISQICKENGLQPTVFHRWKQQFAENMAAAFEKNGDRREESMRQKKAEKLVKKLAQKNEVLSELMQEHIELKKIFGRIEARVGAARYSG